jgi:hypothetical protein
VVFGEVSFDDAGVGAVTSRGIGAFDDLGDHDCRGVRKFMRGGSPPVLLSGGG